MSLVDFLEVVFPHQLDGMLIVTKYQDVESTNKTMSIFLNILHLQLNISKK